MKGEKSGVYREKKKPKKKKKKTSMTLQEQITHLDTCTASVTGILSEQIEVLKKAVAGIVLSHGQSVKCHLAVEKCLREFNDGLTDVENRLIALEKRKR